MGRMIDTDAAYTVLTDYYHHSTDTQHQALKEALGRVETVDAVPVVRCKDCKHRQYDSMDGSFYCGGAFGGIETEADFFCKDGDHNDTV